MLLDKTKKSVLIAPSILSADFSRLGEEVKSVEKIGIDLIHVDVMDGHFVPNITIGPEVVKSIKKHTNVPLDVHLMIKYPERFVADFIQAGSAIITVHIEACSPKTLAATAKKVKANGVLFGVSLNPKTPLKRLEPVLSSADLILVMSVNPGFGGQSFIPDVLPKIRRLRKKFPGAIEVDGGINEKTAPGVVGAGANIIVAGSYIFQAKDRRRAIEKLKQCRP